MRVPAAVEVLPPSVIEVLPLPLAIQERLPIVASVRGGGTFSFWFVLSDRGCWLWRGIFGISFTIGSGVIWLRCGCACSWDKRGFLRVATAIFDD